MQGHPVFATVASAARILLLAAPALAMKLSMPDESAQARGTMGYASYATMAQGFGPGFDAPLIVAATVTAADTARLTALRGAIGATPGIADVTPPVLSRDGQAALMIAYPTTVRRGLAATARVISAAAAIMVVVFGSFDLTPDVSVKQVGFGLTAAVLVDATVARLVLVPAVMELLGRANWWLPGWLDRLLPARQPAPVSCGAAAGFAGTREARHGG